jgi:hypothetical protein
MTDSRLLELRATLAGQRRASIRAYGLLVEVLRSHIGLDKSLLIDCLEELFQDSQGVDDRLYLRDLITNLRQWDEQPRCQKLGRPRQPLRVIDGGLPTPRSTSESGECSGPETPD